MGCASSEPHPPRNAVPSASVDESSLSGAQLENTYGARLSARSACNRVEAWTEIVVEGSGTPARRACEALVALELREPPKRGARWVVSRGCSALPLSEGFDSDRARLLEQRTLTPAQVALALMTAQAMNRDLSENEAIAAPPRLMGANIASFEAASTAQGCRP